MIELNQGFPKRKIFKDLLISDLFSEMEEFSRIFLEDNKRNLEYYSKKWVKDPFHWWSREWEYPFVFNEILKKMDSADELNVLDAGSGITFFPFYLSYKFRNMEIKCLDVDEKLELAYTKIIRDDDKVSFGISDINQIKYDNNSFDLIYSISVLEHTTDYPCILKEFNRILKDDGILILTFDISLDGSYDLPLSEAINLVKEVLEYFEVIDYFDPIKELNDFNHDPNTYLSVKWPKNKFEKIKSLLKISQGSSELTIFCLTLKKKLFI